jgi:uncharacterized delta-60 repeat protein
MKINKAKSKHSFVLRIILTVVLIAFFVGLLASSFMAQTPASAITKERSDALPKGFGRIADCGPAELDPTFGGTGKVTTDFAGSDDSAYSVTLQADGKIVAAGSSAPVSDFAVVRYNTDGSLDTSFGGTGKVRTDVISYDVATSVAIQTDGKIVVAGYASGSNYDFALVRYHTDGSLDTSFGGMGKVTTDFGSDDFASSVAIQADGKIVATGSSGGLSNNDFALVRYNSDGSLDASFGGTGKITTDFGSRAEDQARSVTIQADGKIVAAGYSGHTATHDFALVRYGVPCGSPTPTPTPATITVKVGTKPSGRSFSVDGTTYTSNQTFSWEAGSNHTIATTSPQSAGTGTQYVWTNWSDNGAISHVVAPTTNARFVANFQLQYFLTMAVSGNGQVKPVSAWQNAGNMVTIQARANQGSRFSFWTGTGPGSFTGMANPASVTMKGPITETATFSP